MKVYQGIRDTDGTYGSLEAKSDQLLNTVSLERFIHHILLKKSKRCVVDYIDYVFELEDSYIKFIQVTEYNKEEDGKKFEKLLQYYSRGGETPDGTLVPRGDHRSPSDSLNPRGGGYPESINKNNEVYLNKYFWEHPHKNIASIKNMFILYNYTGTHIELYAGVEMPKYHSLQEANLQEWPEYQKTNFIKGLIEGIVNIHKLKYFHGDLKPMNICYDDNFIPKIIDFGKSDKLDCGSSFTNSFGFCSPTQMYYWMNDEEDGVTRNGKYKFEQIIITDLLMDRNLLEEKIDLNGNPIIVPKDKFMKNDFFTIGLLIIFIFGNKSLFFYNNSNTTNDNILNFIQSYIEFLKDPKTYLASILKEISIPKELENLIQFYIVGYFNKD